VGVPAGARGFFAGGAFVFTWLRGTTFLVGALFNGQAGEAGALAPERGALTTRASSDERGRGEKRRSIRPDGAAKGFDPGALPPQAALRLYPAKSEISYDSRRRVEPVDLPLVSCRLLFLRCDLLLDQ